MYCSSNDVSIKLGFVNDFSTTTQPTKSQVESMIDEVDAEIDIYLSSIGVSLPITNATFLKFISGKSKVGTAGKVGLTYFSNDKTVADTQAKNYWQEYLDFLNLIQTKPEIIAGYMGTQPNSISSNVLDGNYKEKELDKDSMPKRFNL